MSKDDKIVLRDIQGWGFGNASGLDAQGLEWLQFEVDVLADENPGTCAICGAELYEGWRCLDGCDEVCDDHIVIPQELYGIPQ